MRRFTFLFVALAVMLLAGVGMAQDTPPVPGLELEIQTITLIPISAGAESQSGLVASGHLFRVAIDNFAPQLKDKPVIKLIGDHVLTDVVATDTNIEDFWKLKNASLGTSIILAAPDATIQPGLVYRHREGKWYWHLRVKF